MTDESSNDTQNRDASLHTSSKTRHLTSCDDELAGLEARKIEQESYMGPMSTAQHLFHHGLFSDITIRCKGREWKLHRTLLAASCEFFRACLVSNCKEANSGIIDMDNDDPQACGAFLEFLYTSEVELIKKYEWTNERISKLGSEIQNGIDVEFLINLCTMADKYHVARVLEYMADFLAKNPTFASDLDGQIEALLKIATGIRSLWQSAHITLLTKILVKNVFKAGDVEMRLDPSMQKYFHAHGDLSIQMLNGALQEREELHDEYEDKLDTGYCSQCGHEGRFEY